MKLLLIILIILNGCAYRPASNVDNFKLEEGSKKSHAKYKIGDCLYLIDPENGRGNKNDIMRIDEITEEGYYYRWWTYQKEWALELNFRTHDRFERMVKLTECPDV